MKKRVDRIPKYVLIVDAIIALVLISIVLSSRVIVYAPNYKEKLGASKRAEILFNKTKDLRIEKGIPIDSINDPNMSGLIGLQLSPITTDFGDLRAKLTSINPNFSALFVDYLKRLRLKKGDLVAVHFTGSFPGLNLCMHASFVELGLEPIIITSVGASMWGANIPEFTYLDIESALYNEGLISSKTAYASYGGIDDVGRGLTPEGKDLIIKAIKRNGVKEITVRDLQESIETKIRIYEEVANGRPIKAFINVGGNAAVLAGIELPSGIVSFEHRNHPGLIGRFLSKGIPVININNINYLARKHELPLEPVPTPKAGEGILFKEVRYSTFVAIIVFVVFALVLFFTLIVDVDYYLKKLFRRL